MIVFLLKKKQLMIDTEILLMKKQLLELNCNLTPDQFQAFHDLSKDNQKPYYENFAIINQTISKLFNANKSSLLFKQEDFRSLLYRYWHVFFLNIKSFEKSLLKEIKDSGMFELLSTSDQIKLIFKSYINFNSK